MKMLIVVSLLSLACAVPAMAQETLVAMNINKMNITWTYAGDVSLVDYWEISCSVASGQADGTVTRFSDPSVMTAKLADVTHGMGDNYCAGRAGNAFDVSDWGTEVSFLAGVGPVGVVTPIIESR